VVEIKGTLLRKLSTTVEVCDILHDAFLALKHVMWDVYADGDLEERRELE
jgi:hypothetical protein